MFSAVATLCPPFPQAQGVDIKLTTKRPSPGNPPGWSLEETSQLSFFKSIWYVTVTVSTVGYGDLSPVSFMGKLAGIIFIVIGVVFFSANISRISELLKSQADGHGRYSSKTGKHIILTGRVEPVTMRDFAMEFCHREHSSHRKGGLDMCLVSVHKVDVERYVMSGDLPLSRLQMLVGSMPTDVDRVCMHRAQAIFFMGDERHPQPLDHDNEMLLRAFTMLQSKPNLEVFVMLRETRSLKSAIGTMALCTTSFKTGLLARSTFCPGIIPLIGNLLVSVDPRSVERARSSPGQGKRLSSDYLHGLQFEIYTVKIPPRYTGQRFGELVLHNFALYGILIFALGSGEDSDNIEDIVVHPGYYHKIQARERFAFVIAKDNPQEKVDESLKSFFLRLHSIESNDADDAEETQASPSPARTATISGSNLGAQAGDTGHLGPGQVMLPDADTRSQSLKNLFSSVDGLYEARQPEAHGVSSDENRANRPGRRSRRVHPLPKPRPDSKPTQSHSEPEKAMQSLIQPALTLGTEKVDNADVVFTSDVQASFNAGQSVSADAGAPADRMSDQARPVTMKLSAMEDSLFRAVSALRPGIGRKINSLKDLKPDFRDSSHGAEKIVNMQNHVIVCGMPLQLSAFLEPFKPGMFGPEQLGAEAGCDRTVPVLFLWDGDISREQLDAFKAHPSACLLRVPPLNPSSLVKANPEQAMRMVFLVDHRSASQESEPELVDSGVIFAQRFIRQRYPSAARKYFPIFPPCPAKIVT